MCCKCWYIILSLSSKYFLASIMVSLLSHEINRNVLLFLRIRFLSVNAVVVTYCYQYLLMVLAQGLILSLATWVASGPSVMCGKVAPFYTNSAILPLSHI